MVASPLWEERIRGLLVGMAVGDSLGLPREGVTPKRARRLFGAGPLRHQFLLGYGMTSDDTEHALLTVHALLHSNGRPQKFARTLAWNLRFWFWTLPPGVGLATLRACMKLCMGFSAESSGVYSAGNGPAMRAPIVGAAFADSPDLLKTYVRLATRITHTDVRAEEGAWIVASCVAYALKHHSAEVDVLPLLRFLETKVKSLELKSVLERLSELFAENRPSLEAFQQKFSCTKGVTGYIVDTIAASLFCWLRNLESFEKAITDVIELGGDTDTTAAIVGAMSGALLGTQAIPNAWLRICEWPRTVRWTECLAKMFAAFIHSPKKPQRKVRLMWGRTLLRNMFFMGVVLIHGFRRLLPPYG